MTDSDEAHWKKAVRECDQFATGELLAGIADGTRMLLDEEFAIERKQTRNELEQALAPLRDSVAAMRDSVAALRDSLRTMRDQPDVNRSAGDVIDLPAFIYRGSH